MSPAASVPIAPALWTVGAEPREDERRPARRPGGGHADLLDQRPALALGDRLHRPHEHVEDVDAEADDPHTACVFP